MLFREPLTPWARNMLGWWDLYVGTTFRACTYTLTLYSEVFGDRIQTKTTLGRRTIAELARKCDKMGRKRRKTNQYVTRSTRPTRSCC